MTASIRRRLLIILLTLFALAWSALAVFSYLSARHEIEELFDAQLAQSARVLLSLTLHEIEEEAEEPDNELGAVLSDDLAGHRYEEKLAFQVWMDGRLIMRSPNAPLTALSPNPGFADRAIDGGSWRVFSLRHPAQDVLISVGESYEVRDELLLEIVGDLSWPMLLTAPVLALLIGTGVGRGLAPLKRTAREIAQRNPRQLEPLSTHGTPEEVKPLVDSLNDLLARLHDALESERRFTANASHELRTPLAGLKAQAQVALRASSEAERAQAFAQINRGVDRATHLVEQLLTLARLDPDTAQARYEPVSMPALAADILAELGPMALEKNVDLALVEDGAGEILGDRLALAILLRNLVDNAIRYTPPSGRVEVGVRPAGDEVLVWVADSGPGIPIAERERVFERFYRLPANGPAGCGLGLSIVQRIAQLHGARLALSDAGPAGGLRVDAYFPAVPGKRSPTS